MNDGFSPLNISCPFTWYPGCLPNPLSANAYLYFGYQYTMGVDLERDWQRGSSSTGNLTS